MKSLQSLSYKTLLIIFFFSIAGIIFFLKIGSKTTKVSAAWWDEMWRYRRSISISNSSGSNQTNAQIKILDNYDLSSLVSAGKIQSDLDDLRFTDSNNNLLNYWIEDSTNSSVDIWAIIPALSNSGNSILMYYGNPNATSVSSTTNMTIGGTMVVSSGYRTHFFKGSGTLSNGFDTTAEVLVVGGGGGGGDGVDFANNGAGGGAGGLIYNTSFSILAGTYPITVGNGGARNTNGQNSVFSSLTAIGGGKGANATGGQGTGGSGGNGGSGGGACPAQTNIGTGTSGQGYNGGSGATSSPWAAGGGGGAGELGNADGLGLGGDGVSYSISGSAVIYAGGGSGGNDASRLAGGDGGGGSGAVYSDSSGGGNGVANTGGGGGGGASRTASLAGGTGGSGIVIIRYASYGTASIPNALEEANSGPIAYWKFDEGVGTTAYDSAGSNNGSFGAGSSAPTWVNESQCISGKCLSFDGTNDYVQINNLNYTPSSYTISFWAKRNTISNSYATVLGLTSPYKNAVWVYENGNIAFGDANGTWSSWNSVWTDKNNFHHIEITIPTTGTSNTATLYFDGVNKGNITTNSSGTLTSSRIGTFSTVSVNHFTGILDDIKIYPYARTAAQIKNDYNSRGSVNSSSVNLGIKSSTAPDLNSKLVAYYKLDENNGTTSHDSTSNRKDGTISGATWQTENQCVSGKCLSFNGSNNSITINNMWSYFQNASFSISAKVYLNPTTNTQPIISIGSIGNDQFLHILRIDNSNKLRFGFYNDDLDTNSNLNTQTWYNITATWDSVTKKQSIYINGVLDNSRTSSGSLNIPTSSSLYLGLYSTYYLNGKLDEVKIYNSALTADEVKQDYNAGSAIKFSATTQTIGATTTSLNYCIPGDTTYCAAPVAEYNFEENTGTVTNDTSGNNYNATFGTGNSAPTWSVGQNNKGTGLNFDGVISYADLGTSLNPCTSNTCTMSAWIKLSSFPSTGYIFTKGSDSTANSYGILVGGSAISTMVLPASPAWASSGSLLTLGTWYHITGVISGNNIYTYLNGRLVASNTFSGTLASSTNTARIGHQNRSGYYYPFPGQIDNVRIYNYVRTPAQITYDYNKGAPIAQWKLDECQGSTVYDSIGTGDTGVIVIGSSGTQNSLGTCQIGTSAAWTNGASGKINSSLNFDGTDDYVGTSNTSFLPTGANPRSMFGWIKTNGAINSRMNYFGYGGAGTSLTFNLSSGVNNDGKIYFIGYANDLGGNAVIADGNWHHVGVTYNGTIVTLFVDGKVDSTSNKTLNTSDISNYPFAIGRQSYPQTSYYYANSKIDDVRLYNYALTPEQIKQIYNGGAVNFQ